MSGSERDEGGGFFARWSRRKAAQREGVETVEPPRVAPPATAVAAQPLPGLDQKPVATPPKGPDGTPEEAPTVAPAPTLADAEALAPGAEVSRFLAPNVDPGVKNAALKKLFADPHYNVMDGLDTYIDDYSKPMPIPPKMLRQMVQAKLLGLFADEEQVAERAVEPQTPLKADPPSTAATPDIPAAPPPPSIEADNSSPHEDADLRLQPDDAPGGSGAREGTRPRQG